MQSKLIWVVVGLTILIVFLFGATKVITNKVTDRVIERLRKDYSPSPYGPGLDPDKMNPPTNPPTNPQVAPQRTAVWEEAWEASRRD